MNTNTDTPNKTETTNTTQALLQQGIDQVDKLKDDKRITRHIRARVLAGKITKEDALVLVGHLENGDDQSKKLAADLRSIAPSLTAAPSAKPNMKPKASTKTKGTTSASSTTAAALWALVADVQQHMGDFELGPGAKSVEAALKNLTASSESPAESVPLVAALLEKGNAKSQEFAAQLLACSAGLGGGGSSTAPGAQSGAPAAVVTVAPPIDPGTQDEWAEWSKGPIPLMKLEPSKFNRSFGAPPDEEYYQELADSFERDGLMHTLTLIYKSKTDRTLLVLAGENRRRGFLKLRGKDGVLQPGEYEIREDLTEDDPRCFDVSWAENAHRRPPTPVEKARLIVRVLDDKSLTQEQVGKKLGIPTPVVSQLTKLPKWWDRLPDSWKRDLAAAPGRVSSDLNTCYEPAITVGHWRAVVGTLEKKAGLTPKLQKLMEKAATEKQSTKWLDERVKGKKAVADDAGSDGEQGDEQSPPPPAPQPNGPDYDGILVALANATDLAQKDDQVLAVIQTAVDGIVALRAASQKDAAA